MIINNIVALICIKLLILSNLINPILFLSYLNKKTIKESKYILDMSYK